MPEMPTRHLFVDLDGTLTDSAPGIVACIGHALRSLGRPVPPPAELRWCVGPPLLESFTSLLGDAEMAAQALTLYRERFATRGLLANAVYPGIPQVLDSLTQRGYSLNLATSKPLVYARRILAHFELDQYFDQQFGAELDGRLGDKSELLAHALKVTGADPKRSTMVGDRRHDVVGARANGLEIIGVLYGYGSRQELIDAGANRLVDSPTELLDWLTADPATDKGGR